MILILNHSSFISATDKRCIHQCYRLHSWRVCASGCAWGRGDAPEKLQQLVPEAMICYEHQHTLAHVCMHVYI